MDIKKYYIAIKEHSWKSWRNRVKFYEVMLRKALHKMYIFPDLEIGLIQTNVRKDYKKWRWMGMNIPLYLNIILKIKTIQKV